MYLISKILRREKYNTFKVLLYWILKWIIMQNKQTGAIPTHWMKADCSENLENFWINCHIASALWIYELSEFED